MEGRGRSGGRIVRLLVDTVFWEEFGDRGLAVSLVIDGILVDI